MSTDDGTKTPPRGHDIACNKTPAQQSRKRSHFSSAPSGSAAEAQPTPPKTTKKSKGNSDKDLAAAAEARETAAIKRQLLDKDWNMDWLKHDPFDDVEMLIAAKGGKGGKGFEGVDKALGANAIGDMDHTFAGNGDKLNSVSKLSLDEPMEQPDKDDMEGVMDSSGGWVYQPPEPPRGMPRVEREEEEN